MIPSMSARSVLSCLSPHSIALIWFVVGLLVSVSGWLGLLGAPLQLLLLLPLMVLIYELQQIWSELQHSPRLRTLALLLALIWISHAIQVFVPETGFDAVWYHLPVAAADIAAGKFVFMPELYQSANPLFSDSIFFLGFMLSGELGAKGVAYLLGLSLVLISYKLAKTLLSPAWALLAAAMVSVMQGVTWQSASFYVDVALAMWLLGAIGCTLTSTTHTSAKPTAAVLPISLLKIPPALIVSSMFLGAALATKLFAILYLPLFAWIYWQRTRSVRLTGILLLLAGLVLLPYLVFAAIHLGNPFYSIFNHVAGISAIGAPTLVSQIISATASLWYSPIAILLSRDYISPMVILTVPALVWLMRSRRVLHEAERLLGLFVINSWLIWWYVPPRSTRYALAGFIVLLLLLIKWAREYFVAKGWKPAILYIACVCCVLLLVIPRIMVNVRSARYLTGMQSKTDYISQFKDGWIDAPLTTWHQLD